MPRLQAKSFDTPDETRTLPKATADVVNVGEVAVGYAVWQPGWRWSSDLGPIAGTDWCESHHLGYALSGTLDVLTEDGDRLQIHGRSVYEIPPRHDAWVVGDEPFVTVEWTSSRVVGIASEGPGSRVLATVLFTDIVDSTATLERLGDAAWREVLLTHNARIREVIDAFRGREISTTGDGFLVVFDGATNAVRCGTAMVRAAEALGSRSESASIRARSSSSPTMSEASPSMPPRGSWQPRVQARSWSRTRRMASSKGLDCRSTTPDSTPSRDYPVSASCSG